MLAPFSAQNHLGFLQRLPRGGRCSVFLTMRCFNDVYQFLAVRFLADGFEKTSTSMFWTMFEKIQNIVLTMHISDVFQTIN